MNTNVPIVRWDREAETIVLIPTRNLSELEADKLTESLRQLQKLLEDPSIVNVVVDFEGTDYFGSSAASLAEPRP